MLRSIIRLITKWVMSSGSLPRGGSWGKFGQSAEDRLGPTRVLRGESDRFTTTIASSDSYGINVAVNGAQAGDPVVAGFDGTVPSNFRLLVICKNDGVVEVTIFNDTVAGITFTNCACKVVVFR